MGIYYIMKGLIRKVLKEIRNKDIYSAMRPFFDSTPEYVFRQFFYVKDGFFKTEFERLYNEGADDDDIYEQFEDFIDLQWSKKVIVVNISDFTKSTQRDMVRRKMGQEEEEGVPNDTQRSEKQKELMDKYGEGNNEPVIIIKTDKGYDLMEGWHRTMSILSLGSNGTDNYKKWRKVKIKAWIGE